MATKFETFVKETLDESMRQRVEAAIIDAVTKLGYHVQMEEGEQI